MFAKKSHTPGDIEIGRFSFRHNRFLMFLACLVALAYVIADSVGASPSQGAEAISKLAAPQIIWSIMIVPIAAFGTWALKRAGHSDTALSCTLAAFGFICGAGISTFF
jgi:hypothetical protein